MKQTLLLIFLIIVFLNCNRPNYEELKEYNKLGAAYMQNGEEDSAIFFFHKAIRTPKVLQVDQSNITRNIAIAYKQQYLRDSILYIRSFDSAKVYFKAAADIFEDGAYLNSISMADYYLLEGKNKKAIDFLENAWNVDSTQIAVNNSLGLIYLGENGVEFFDPKKALKYNQKVDMLNSNRLSKFVLAKNYYYLEDYSEAETRFKKLYEDYPQFIDYLVTIIMIQQKSGKIKESKSNLELLKVLDQKKYDQYVNSTMGKGE